MSRQVITEEVELSHAGARFHAQVHRAPGTGGAGLAGGAGRSVAPTLVCLHGFPDTNATFGPLAERLAAAGFDVVCPALRGYEPSSVVAGGDYDLASLAGDVVAWLDELGLERTHLFGHDWGAAIAYTAAAGYPDRFHTLTASSVPPLLELRAAVRRSPRQVAALWYQMVFQVPGLSERLLARDRAAFAELLWQRWSPGWELPRQHLDRVRDALGRPGVASATLAYYRQQFERRSGRATATASMVGRTTDVPALVLAGADDGCFLSGTYRSAVEHGGFTAGVALHVLDGVGHFPHLEQPDRAAALVLDHLHDNELSDERS